MTVRAGLVSAMLKALVVVALALRVGLLVADFRAPTRAIDLRTQGVTSPSAGLYAVPIDVPHTWWWHAPGDSNEAPAASTLVLYEGTRALGPAHEPHAVIAGGDGRYSHWGEWLYFSTSDGTDPRTNGRRYRVEVRLAIAPVVSQAANVLLVASVLLLGATGTLSACCVRRATRPAEPLRFTLAAAAAERVFGAPGSVARRRAGIASGCLLGLLASLAVFVPERQIVIDPSAVQAGNGRLHYVALGVSLPFPFRMVSDSAEAPRTSSLRLYEDGRALELAHSEHSIIETRGTGHYSFWNGFLYFSSSDGTEPASGAHRYTATYKPALRPGLLPAASLLCVLAGVLAWPAASSRIAERLLLPARALPAPWSWAIVGTAIVVCGGYVIWNWTLNPGPVPAPSLAGYLPISDALGYNTCATQAALLGHFMDYYEFCSRRTLYPSMLASLHLLTRSQAELILLLQAGIVAAALGFFVMRLARVLSPLAAVLGGAVLFVYASQYVLGLFMTEVVGFVFGLLALSLFLDEREGEFRGRFLVACAMLSVALVARNGAMFMLPALLAWALLERRRAGIGELLRFGIATAAALAFSLLLQQVILGFNGVEAVHSFNNFSTVLYRLSVGATDWTQALIDYPKLPNEPQAEQFARIYGHAIANIVSQPMVFAAALGRAFQTYVHTLYHFVGTLPFSHLLNGLTAVGLVGCVFCWRQRTCRLLLFLAAGEMLSAPLIVEDGGMRVFAASVALRVIFAAAGAVILLTLMARAGGLMVTVRGRLARPFDADASSHGHRHEFVLATTLVGLALLPYIGVLSAPLRPAPLVGTGCPSGMHEAVVDLRHESFSIGVADGRWSGYAKPLLLDKRRLLNGVRSTWYESEIAALPERALVIQGIDRAPYRFARPVLLSIEDARSMIDTPGPDTVCFVLLQEWKVAGRPYRRIEHVGPAGPLAP